MLGRPLLGRLVSSPASGGAGLLNTRRCCREWRPPRRAARRVPRLLRPAGLADPLRRPTAPPPSPPPDPAESGRTADRVNTCALELNTFGVRVNTFARELNTFGTKVNTCAEKVNTWTGSRRTGGRSAGSCGPRSGLIARRGDSRTAFPRRPQGRPSSLRRLSSHDPLTARRYPHP